MVVSRCASACLPITQAANETQVSLRERSRPALLSSRSRRSRGGWGALRHHQALRVRHYRREEIDLRIERLAQSAQQTHHAPDQEHVAGNFDHRVRANRARHLLRELLDQLLVGVGLLRLDRAAEKEIGKGQQRVWIAVARAESKL